MATIWLLGAASLLALLQAVMVHTTGGSATAAAVAWFLFATLAVGCGASLLHFRQVELFRKRLSVGLTHHMRTSLAHIRTFNEMLLLGSAADDEQRTEWLEVVGREAERLGTAMENVLLIVNEQTADAYPVRRAIDLEELLEDVACGFSVDCNGAPRAYSTGRQGIFVDADPAALKHALANLFQSLGRFCDPEARLSAALSSNGSTATIVIGLENAGPGAAREIGDANPLRESDLEGETGTGFGLELAVVQHVARAHGGRATPFHEAARSGYRLELPLSRA